MCDQRADLQLLGADVQLEQRVAEDVAEAAGEEVAVRPPVVLGIMDLRELQAPVPQQLLAKELLVGQVNLEQGRGTKGSP